MGHSPLSGGDSCPHLPASGFFGNGDGGVSRPPFHAGESLAGNDSLEASSTGSSTAPADRGSGLGVFLDLSFVRVFDINCPLLDFCSSQRRVSTTHKPVDTFWIGSKLEVKSHILTMPVVSMGRCNGSTLHLAPDY